MKIVFIKFRYSNILFCRDLVLDDNLKLDVMPQLIHRHQEQKENFLKVNCFRLTFESFMNSIKMSLLNRRAR